MADDPTARTRSLHQRPVTHPQRAWGLLGGEVLALAQAAAFTAATAAPRASGVVKLVQAWTLSELIAAAREIRVLSEDVARHADHVRKFRNYIHPRHQLKESFEPRIETARIAQQVLRAALVDLEQLGGLSDRR